MWHCNLKVNRKCFHFLFFWFLHYHGCDENACMPLGVSNVQGRNLGCLGCNHGRLHRPKIIHRKLLVFFRPIFYCKLLPFSCVSSPLNFLCYTYLGRVTASQVLDVLFDYNNKKHHTAALKTSNWLHGNIHYSHVWQMTVWQLFRPVPGNIDTAAT